MTITRAPRGPNPRWAVVEERVESLADELRWLGHPMLAAQLAEVVPASLVLVDQHSPLLVQRLDDVVSRGLSPDINAAAQRILAALTDLPAAIGRRGTVWSAWHDYSRAYSTHWECPEGFLETGPDADLDATLRWAHARAPVILLRPEWDPIDSYSAGEQMDPRYPELPAQPRRQG